LLNIAVLISGNGTNLQALIDAQNSSGLTCGRITLVISSRADAYGLIRAEKNNIKTEVVDRKLYRKSEEFDQRIAYLLHKHNIHIVVLAGFLSILGPELVKQYDYRMINIHPSLIPAFCGNGLYGLRVHEEVLKKGVKLTGATVHYVNEIPDGGDIILQKAVKVMADDTPESLQKRVMEEAEWQLLPEAVNIVCKKWHAILQKKGSFI
jgi:phosphoribosylglycinamide formyltransferase-1